MMREAFTLLIALLLVVALNLEFAGLGTLGGLLRAVAVLASTLLAWKIHRAPAEPDRLSRALRAAGVALATGFTVAAIAPHSQPHEALPPGSTWLIGSPIAYSYALNDPLTSGSGWSQRPPSGV